MRPIYIIVADDHPIVLHGIVTLLRNDKRFKIAAICKNGQESIDAVRDKSPDLALLDINMPELNGLDVLKAVNEERLMTRVVFLAGSPTDSQIITAREDGAYGIMLKEEAADALIDCLQAVASGQKWFPAGLLTDAIERTKEHRLQIARVENLLTRREIEVMLEVSNGLSNKDVGVRLNISEGTVKIHLNSIYHKIGINNRTALANFAIAYRERLMADEF